MKKKALILLSFLIMASLSLKIKSQSNNKDHNRPFDMKAAHKLFMLYGWTIFADLIVILAYYQYRKYTRIIHALAGTAIVVTTLITSLPSLLKNGFNTKHISHYIIGVVIYGMMALQILLGIIKFLMAYFNKGSAFTINLIKVVHKWHGYILLIICKISIFTILGRDRPEYLYLLWWECAVVMILGYRYVTFRKLQQVIYVDIGTHEIIKNISKLKGKNKEYVIFGNWVYDIAPLRNGHPAGFKIIQGVINKSVDKFLYGINSSEDYHSISKYSHSAASLKLMEKPLAKISIDSPFEGFEDDVVNVDIHDIVEVSQSLYEIKLTKSRGCNFVYKGYTSRQQIGRYHSLTIDNKITRLYTSVNFLTKKNKDHLQKIFFNKMGININYIHFDMVNNSLNENITKQEEGSELSLLIKQYEKGALTKDLLNMKDKTLQLSSERGQGLQLQNLLKGRVIVVVGGTGLFPFCDLIDLLFKDALLRKAETKVAAAILREDPILNLKPFENLSFEFMGSFHRIEDIHKITLHQILFLLKNSNKFRFLFRLGHRPSEQLTQNNTIEQTKQHFNVLLSQQILKQNLSKVWVCGPPRMNATLKKLLSKTLSLNQYEIF